MIKHNPITNIPYSEGTPSTQGVPVSTVPEKQGVKQPVIGKYIHIVSYDSEDTKLTFSMDVETAVVYGKLIQHMDEIVTHDFDKLILASLNNGQVCFSIDDDFNIVEHTASNSRIAIYKKMWYIAAMSVTNLEFFRSSLDLIISGDITKTFVSVTDDDKNKANVAEQLGKKPREYIKQDKEDYRLGVLHDCLASLYNYDIDMFTTIEQVILYVEDTYSDKYEQSFFKPINMTRSARLGFGMNIGAIAKYIARYAAKGGEKTYNKKDLYKAVHYILFEITRRNIEDSKAVSI